MLEQKKIKIARVIARLNIGGPAIHAAILSAGLNSGIFRTRLICGSVGPEEGDMSYYATGLGVQPLFLTQLGREIRWWSDLSALWRLYKFFKAERPHIVHTHTAKAGALGRIAAIAAGVPVKVHTFHGHVFHGYFGPLKNRAFIAIERLLARFTDRIIVLSESQRRDICQLYKVTREDRVSIIPLGLDLVPFFKYQGNGSKLRRELGIPREAFAVGIVGRLVEVKDHRLFLRAAKILKDEWAAEGGGRPAPRFLIVGDGHLRGKLEALAEELSLGDCAIFTGWRRDLLEVYSALDLVALTSRNEGTPVSLIEGMASSKPVVAAQVGGVGDLFEQVPGGKPPDGLEHLPGLKVMANGILVAERDESTLARAISLMIKDKRLRLDMGMRGRELVMRRYSASRLIGDMEELYRELITRKSHGLTLT